MRLRLVSLMRMQSIFILPGGRPQQKVAIAKESGRNRYKYYLSESDWRQYNLKYEGLACHLLDDTMHILGYTCRKAIITLKNKETVTVYYTPSILEPALADAEPLFSGVPGLALRYEYTHRKGTIIYTATNINRHSIDPAVFSVPGDDFPIKKYIPGKG